MVELMATISDSSPEPSAESVPSVLPELKPRRRAYLDGLNGYEPVENWGLQDGADPAKRQRAWVAQRARYGFDSRSTWSLDTAMLELAYERLRMFRDLAPTVISLEYHKFEWLGATIDQGEAIDLLIGFAEDALDSEMDEPFSSKAADNFWSLWALVHRVMWW